MLHKSVIFSLVACSVVAMLPPQYYQYSVAPQQPNQPSAGNYVIGGRTTDSNSNQNNNNNNNNNNAASQGFSGQVSVTPDGHVQLYRNGKLILTNCRVCRLCCMGPINVLPPGVTQVPVPTPRIETTPTPSITSVPQVPVSPFVPVTQSPIYPINKWAYPTPGPNVVNQYQTPPQTTTTTIAPTTTTTTQAPPPCIQPTTTTPVTTARPPCQTVPVDTYPTPPTITTTTFGYPTAPPAYPTIPETPIIPIVQTTVPPAVQQCCTVELRNIQATVSCGTSQCCSQTCTNQKTVTVTIPFPVLGLPTKIPCREAVAKGIVKEDDVRGVCEKYNTIYPAVPAPEIAIPTAVPSTEVIDGAYVTTPDATSSSTMVGALITFIVATLVCF